MQFVISQEGETLSRLVRRLFGQATATQHRKIVALVREANPGLAAESIPAGTVVIVPHTDEIEPSSDVRTERQIAAALVRSVHDQIGDVGSILAELVDRQEQQARETLDLAKSREVRNLAKQNRLVQDCLRSVAENADARLKRSKVLRSLVVKADAEIKSDLGDLLAALDPPGTARQNSKKVRRRK